MSWPLICLIILSVALSSGSQLALKRGMTAPEIQSMLHSQKFLDMLFLVITSPAIILGLFLFGISVIVWLLVLSKIPVSTAYPFVALGITTTVLGGRFIFGEPMSLLKITGVTIILLGIFMVALAGSQESKPQSGKFQQSNSSSKGRLP